MSQKICSQCQTSFSVSEYEKQFLAKISLKVSEKIFEVPEPSMCPDCRCQFRVMHRNESHLHHNVSVFSQKPIISVYAAGGPWKIVTQEEWWSDDYDPLSYGRDFDFSRPFFEQFQELRLDVPRFNLVTVDNENSPYTTGTGYCKNCHLINSSENCEDCYYGKLLQRSKNIVDSSYVYDSELVYEGFNVKKCYNCCFLANSDGCTDCFFSDDLHGCKNCFLCTNLSKQQYCFMNQKLSKEEYSEKIKEFFGSYAGVEKAKAILSDIRAKRIYKYSDIFNSENCTGDFIYNSQNCLDCYDVSDSQDCRYVQVGVQCKDILDCSNMYIKPQLSYQVLGVIETYNVNFCVYVFHSQDVWYSELCYHSNNLFGCAGLKKNSYCILNKQYSKEEYEKMMTRIIEHMKRTGEWGQFFPSSLSPFAYNETLASDYFPMGKEGVLAKGWKWREDDANSAYQGPHYEVPDQIQHTTDDITQAVLECEITKKLYKILPQELKFYRMINLPIPRKCPDQRHKERMMLRNPRKLYERPCMKCGKNVQSTFPTSDFLLRTGGPERKEKIYCEECYLAEVY